MAKTRAAGRPRARATAIAPDPVHRFCCQPTVGEQLDGTKGEGLALPARDVDPRMDANAMAGEQDRADNPGQRLSTNPPCNETVQQSVVATGSLYQFVGLLQRRDAPRFSEFGAHPRSKGTLSTRPQGGSPLQSRRRGMLAGWQEEVAGPPSSALSPA